MAVADLSNLEVKSLFEAWGFAVHSGNGGHLVMRHTASGRKVQITAPGRKDRTPMRALAKGARVVGVSLHDFRVGPPPAPTGPGHDDVRSVDDTIDLREEHEPVDGRVQPTTGAGRGDVPGRHPDAPPRTSDDGYPDWFDPSLGPTDLLEVAMRAHPDTTFNRAELAEVTGLSADQVSSSLQRLVQDPDRYVIRVARGVYRFDLERRHAEQEAERRDEARAARAAAEAAAVTFTCVGTDPAGRAMLCGPDGNFWVAIPVEPGFFALPERPADTNHRQPITPRAHIRPSAAHLPVALNGRH